MTGEPAVRDCTEAWPRGTTPLPRSGEVTESARMRFQSKIAYEHRSSQEEQPHTRGQGWQREEIPLVQGKEQWLHFAGAAVRRYAMTKVRETQVRW